MPSLCHRTPWPRQPTSGSELSLRTLCRHVVVFDPGKSIGCIYPVPSPTALAFANSTQTRHFHYPHTCASRGASLTRLHYRSLALQPADLLAPLAQLTETFTKADNPMSFTFLGREPFAGLSQRGLLLPGFQRIGHPHRRRISLPWQLGKFHGRDFHPQEWQLASLHVESRCGAVELGSWHLRYRPFRMPVPH